MQAETILQQLNLTKKQAQIYLACLKEKTGSISQIAKKADIKRPTAYLVIEELIKKGLLMKTSQGKRTYYKPEAPQKILQNIEQQKSSFLAILPQLESIYQSQNNKPKMSFYEGKKAIGEISQAIWRAKEIWAVFSADNFLKHFKLSDNKHFFNILIRNGGIIYDILEDTPKARKFAQSKYRCGVSKVKFLPKNVKIKTDIQVWGNKVALTSFENLTCTIIEDESIAKTQLQLLQLIWQNLP